jgi:hypothetical protein
MLIVICVLIEKEVKSGDVIKVTNEFKTLQTAGEITRYLGYLTVAVVTEL